MEQVLSNYMPTLKADLSGFAPELVLSGTIIAMLLVRVFVNPRFGVNFLALAGTAYAFYLAICQWGVATAVSSTAGKVESLFGGMLILDAFSIYLKVFLFGFTAATIVLTMLTRIPDAEDSADFYSLLLGSVIGMSLMASSNNLLMIFIAVEMASVPSYALAGFLKGRRQSSEAALKYVVYGGAAAGIMVYGLSLLAGMYGTLDVIAMSQAMMRDFSGESGQKLNPAVMVAFLTIIVGFAFKLSAFPFHFWCPDVFEGAAAEVAGFLSVASKAAAIAMVARFTNSLVGNFHDAGGSIREWAPAVATVGNYLKPTLGLMAALTCTFGNMAAYGQKNLKRLLAYSTIAHAGYMLLALSSLSTSGAKAALFYLLIYFFMNLGAFAVVAFMRNKTGSEEIDAYQGLIYKAPVLAVTFAIFLLSLVGMPPLAGFNAKFQVFAVLYEQKLFWLLAVGGLNTVLSLFYYLNVVRVMILKQPEVHEAPFDLPNENLFVLAMAVPILLFGVLWSVPDGWAIRGADSLKNPSMPIFRADPDGDVPKLRAAVEASTATQVAGGPTK